MKKAHDKKKEMPAMMAGKKKEMPAKAPMKKEHKGKKPMKGSY